MQGITGIGADPFKAFRAPQANNTTAVSLAKEPAQPKEAKSDSVELSTAKKENNDKIGFFRLAFKRLTDEQIAKVNETKQLPKKAKFRQTLTGPSGGFKIQNNIFNLTTGTRTLPEGYEVRKNKLGFTRVVPKDSEGFWLKKDKKAKEVK